MSFFTVRAPGDGFVALSFHVHDGRFFAALDAFEQEKQRNATERQPAEQCEIVHECPQMRLPVKCLVNEAVGLVRGGRRIGLPRSAFWRAAMRCVKARL